MERKTIFVVAAVIRDGNSVFATQRGYGEHCGRWEFPGGKVERGESPQDALKREILEELNTNIHVGDLIDTVEYDYPDFHLSMACYWCKVASGRLELLEHKDARWVPLSGLEQIDWLPADRIILPRLTEAVTF